MVDEPKKQPAPRKQPIRREPEHEEIPNRSLFLLKRNIRQLIGFFLILAVGGFIYYVATKPRELESASQSNSSVKETAPGNGTGTSGTSGTSDSTDATSSNPDLSNGENSSSAPNELGSPSTASLQDSPKREKSSTNILETGSAAELIEELLRLQEYPITSVPTINFSRLQRRSNIARRLLEMELSESQNTFAINELIENSLQLDAVNKSEKLNDDQTREKLIQIRDTYCDHEVSAIAAKASLAFPLIPLHNYFTTKDPADLEATADQFDLHGDKILRHPETTARLAKLVIDLLSDSGYSDRHRDLAIRFMTRLEKSEDKKIKRTALAVREQIYFSQSELGSLVERIEGGNTIARDHVQILFEGLDANPSSRLAIYQIAEDVIAEYQRLGHSQDAEALVDWLASINEKNENKKNRDDIAEACQKFKEDLKNEAASNKAEPSQSEPSQAETN